MKRKYIISLIIAIVAVISLPSCIEDGFSSSSADQPQFSVDTLYMGEIFTGQVSTTHRMTVYNPADKGISIGRIRVSGPNASLFRLNVDGFSGTDFQNVEIRANDSIFILVSATLPENGEEVPVDVNASLDFETLGVSKSVVLNAQGRDVTRLRAVTLMEDTRFAAGRPYQIFDSLVVSEGVTLDIDPGADLRFHDGASMIVRGTLKAVGKVGSEISFAGDRTGNVVTDISFDIMSRQWQGIFFTPTSRDNELSYAHVRNTWQGVTVNGYDSAEPVDLTMVNSRLRNAAYCPLEAYHAKITAYGCEFAEAGQSAAYLVGGDHVFENCTFANYYLFSAISSPIITLAHTSDKDADESDKPFMEAGFFNSIIYGLGTDFSHGDLEGTNVYLYNCLLKSAGSNDDHFVDCLWDSDPLFRTVREDYYFDYRLKEDSPARDAGQASYISSPAWYDRYGTPRKLTGGTDLGAYVYTEAE